jgi:hypothetical protein
MLPIFLDCLFVIAPSIFSNVYSVICNESISAVTLSHAMCTIKTRILILVRITSLTPPQLYQPMKVSGHVYVFYRYRFCYSFSDFSFRSESATISAWKRSSVRLYLQFSVGGLMSYLRYWCLLAYSSVQHILTVWVTCWVSYIYPIIDTLINIILQCINTCTQYQGVASF